MCLWPSALLPSSLQPASPSYLEDAAATLKQGGQKTKQKNTVWVPEGLLEPQCQAWNKHVPNEPWICLCHYWSRFLLSVGTHS